MTHTTASGRSHHVSLCCPTPGLSSDLALPDFIVSPAQGDAGPSFLRGGSSCTRLYRCRRKLVQFSHRVRAADGGLLVQLRADGSGHLPPADALAIDAPDDS